MFPIAMSGKLLPRERELDIDFPLNEQHPDPSTGLNESVIEFRATPMRVDENYSFYYVNLTRLIVTGIVPFGALAMLNFSIYRWVSILASKPSERQVRKVRIHAA